MSDSYKIYASKDYVDSKALPEGATAHQMLVTDSNGEKKWEEQTHYKNGQMVNIKLSPENTVKSTSSSGVITYQAVNSSSANPDVLSALTVISDDIFEHRANSRAYAFYWDGVRYLSSAAYYPFMIEFDNNADVQVFYQSQKIFVRVTFRDEAEHTFGYESFGYELKQLDEEFIPDAIARKTDIPTLPETIDPHMQLVTDKNGEKVWEERTHYTGKMVLCDALVSSDYDIFPLSDSAVLTEGEVYTVTLDGATMNITCSTVVIIDIETVGLEFPDPNVKVFYVEGMGIAFWNDGNEHSITIEGNGYKKISDKYLPHATSDTAGILTYDSILNYAYKELEIVQGETTYEDIINSLVTPSQLATIIIYHNGGHVYVPLSIRYYVNQNTWAVKASCAKGHGTLYFQFAGSEMDDVLTKLTFVPELASDSVTINSSTEGSTKKFKITVDDSGTLTATEVTE